MPSCRVRESLSRVTAVFSGNTTEGITLCNAEFGAYQDMLRGCEESLFSQQVGDDDEIIEGEQE